MPIIIFYLTCAIALFCEQTFVIASPNRPSGCPACTEEEMARCPLIHATINCELVTEPNCGCCKMCAKLEGEQCGVAKGICKTGLICSPPSLEYDTFYEALLAAYAGRFTCTTEEKLEKAFPGILSLLNSTEETYDQYDDDYISATDAGEDVFGTITEVQSSNSVKPDTIPTPPYPNAQNPCSLHFAEVWEKKHFEIHEWLPDCENEEYYPLQCELSYARTKGRCWCVNRQGFPVSGFLTEHLPQCSQTLNL